MDRRKLVTAGTLGAAGGLLAACGDCRQPGTGGPAISRGRIVLSMVTTWPEGLPGLGRAAERVGERLSELTDGRITVDLYPAGKLVPALEAFDTVSNGGADMYHGAEYYWLGKSKAFAFFTAVPFGMTAQEFMGWVEFGGGQALWEDLSRQYNVIAFQGANTGHQMGGWFKRPIRSLEDFRGLKMRIPGLGGDMVRALGGTPITLSGSEVYQALQTGQIDATEWVGPWNDFYLGFHREARYYYGPGFHEPGAALAVGINTRTWERLAPSDQALIRSVCSEVNHLSLGEFTYQNAVHLEKLRELGTEISSFPDDVAATAAEAASEIRAEAGAGGGLERRIHASFEDALRRMRRWAVVSEGGYYAARETG